jgi:hypothetical protein
MATMDTKEATLATQASSSKIHHLSTKRSMGDVATGGCPEWLSLPMLEGSVVAVTVTSCFFSFLPACLSMMSKDLSDSNLKLLF